MTTTRLALLSLPLAASVLWLWPAKAQDLRKRFDAFDTNQDGILSGPELDASPLLRRLDTNGDGEVTPQEAAFAIGGLMKKKRDSASEFEGLKTTTVFTRVDRNGDGALTPDELPDTAWFKRLDTNQDGRISREEALNTIGERFSQSALTQATSTEPSPISTEPLTEGPQILKGSDYGVGHRLTELSLQPLQGSALPLSAIKGRQGLVIGLFTSACPISRKLGTELKRLETELLDQGFGVAWLNAQPDATREKSREFATDFALQSPLYHDPDRAVLQALRATTTTEVFLIDSAQTLIYRGAINDQYGLSYAKKQASHHYLREAATALLSGRLPLISATTAPGCALDLPSIKKPTTTALSTATYHRDIARIMQTHCIECHRQDGIGPFALDSLEAVLEHAGMIRKQVERGAMPPWFAAPAPDPTHALFANDSSLNPTDKATLITWLASDRPTGDPAEAPRPRQFDAAWSIGTPDAILTLPKPISIKAEGVMPYQNVVIDTDYPEDRWVSAYEIQPSARQVVHHVIVRVHRPGERVRSLGEGDGFWAAYVPGNSHRILPPGFARSLPAGARLSLQIHYTPIGTATTDQTRIGLVFADQPPQYEVRVTALANPRINIPAGAANHEETLSRRLPKDFMVTGFMPHLHTRGKAFKYQVRYADGRSETLLDVPRYDFNWQLQYTYAQPKLLPAGSTVTITAAYDNSSSNPANPDPTKNVRWGEQTWDEMMIGYIEHFVPRSDPGLTSSR
jgi:mono/diheme cytochrome c family protein